ncbi:MAG: galactose mutarotase [Planctomycetes bacterium]|nr:galactose mutarotase [Planctomycetota bacterium]
MLLVNTTHWPLALLAVVVGTLATTSVAAEKEKKGTQVSVQPFGKLADGSETKLFTLTNAQGLVLKLTDYGARIVAVEAPDRAGKKANVTLGFDSAEKYAANGSFFGCTTGRYANRIAKGRFTLEGKEYKLATNNGPNHLHGGTKGIDRYVWKSESITGPGNLAGVQFTHISPDGDEGYPGALSMMVTYLLTENNEVRIDYAATTDKPTVLNLTNHAYWNLAGAGNGDVLSHKLTVGSDQYLAVDDGLIPTGKYTPTKGSHMDFTQPQVIGSRIAETKKGTPNPNGYDHCYVLPAKNGELVFAARAEDPQSGRVMEIFTTEPGIQFYTGNFLDGSAPNGGFQQHGAFCLETQHFPDSPNHPEFPTTVLRPGQTYKQSTVHKFSVAK